MNPIKTDRLILRNFQPADADALREIILQKEASAYAVYDYEWPTSENEIRDIAAWFSSGDSYLAVCLKDTGQLIGFIALNEAGEESTRSFDLGYAFNYNFHGRGYATEGCTAALHYAFSELGVEGVTSGTAELNVPSCRLLERLGLRKVSESTVSFRKTPAGEPISFTGLAFEITCEEWKNLAGR